MKLMKILLLRFQYRIGYGDEEEVETDPDDLSDFFSQLAEASPEEELEPTDEDEGSEEGDDAGAGDDAGGDEVVVPVVPVEEGKPAVVTETPPVPEQPVIEEPVKPEPVKELTPEEQQAEYQQVMGELQKVYAISDEDADAILTDPKEAVPKLMANAHVLMMQTVHNMIQAQFKELPNIIQNVQQQSQTKQTLLEKFSNAWPELAKEDMKAVTVAAIDTVRRLNPGIDVDTLIQKVGPVAYSIAGKQMPVAGGKAPSGNAAPAKHSKPRPHVPARTRETPPAKTSQTGDPVADFIGSLLERKD